MESHKRLHDSLLELLWDQWSRLGISGTVSGPDSRIIDPEALLCATCIVGRTEPRLFDEAMDWLRENGSLIHLSRLKTVCAFPGLECARTLSAMALHLEKKAGTQKWKSLILDPITPMKTEPFFRSAGNYKELTNPDSHFASQGWLRGTFQWSGKSKPAMGNGGSNLIIRFRALMGVNARSEIIAFLLCRGEGHPPEIARQTHYFTKTVQDALVQMRQSGLIRVRSDSGRKVYSMDGESWKHLLFPEGGTPTMLDWPVILSAILELARILLGNAESDQTDLMRSARLKEWSRKRAPDLEAAGFPVLLERESDYPGETYLPVFQKDFERIIAFLGARHPA